MKHNSIITKRNSITSRAPDFRLLGMFHGDSANIVNESFHVWAIKPHRLWIGLSVMKMLALGF